MDKFSCGERNCVLYYNCSNAFAFIVKLIFVTRFIKGGKEF
ncbi:hypothetical protein CLOLEP_02704 [[Clostridium] leptum DSM 753]|uniref:Uncharacterized protein n=1 Tax=[Clostridium] leptum DSM 753 TaxID=428125 RepID=A7VVU1_9FIRM|nr:hypothetical protein CLOLEP_02704 [[Clostridium] leptum DSM 753]